MKTLGAGAAFLALFFLANVVAAGVMAVLMPYAMQLEDGDVFAGIVVGLVAIASALAFLRGATFYLVALLRVQPHPNKGLESGQGRRGG